MKPDIVYNEFERRQALPDGGMWVRVYEIKVRFSNRETAFAMMKKLQDVFKGKTSADYAMGYGEGFNDACAPKPEEKSNDHTTD